MTDAQAAAFTQLRRLAAPDRLRVVPDSEGYPVIRGQFGDIEWYHAEGTHLAAYTAGPTVRLGRLLSLPGIIRHQLGDTEARVLFPIERLAEIAEALRVRRRRRVSPEHLAKLQAGLLASQKEGREGP